MKTLEEFESENNTLDLDKYLGSKPVQIDEDLCNYIICAYVAPNFSGRLSEGYHIDQQGEAHSSFEDNDDKETYTYLTVASYPDNTYWYLGILPDLNR